MSLNRIEAAAETVVANEPEPALKQSSVYNSLAKIGDLQEQLRSRIDSLAAALSPISVNRPSLDIETADLSSNEEACDLGAEIRGIEMFIRDMVSRISDMKDNLDI